MGDISVTLPEVDVKVSAEPEKKGFSLKFGKKDKKDQSKDKEDEKKPEEEKDEEEDSKKKEKDKHGGFHVSLPSFGFGTSGDKSDVDVSKDNSELSSEIKADKDISVTLPEVDVKVSAEPEKKGFSLKFGKKDKKEKSKDKEDEEKPEEVKDEEEDSKKKEKDKHGGFHISLPSFGFGTSGDKPDEDTSIDKKELSSEVKADK